MTSRAAELLHTISSLGVSIQLVEQKLGIAVEVASRMYVTGQGKMVFEGTSDELKNITMLEKMAGGISAVMCNQ